MLARLYNLVHEIFRGFWNYIIYKVCSVYSICDTMTLALEIIPNADIPFYTPRISTFLRELYLYNFIFSPKYIHF